MFCKFDVKTIQLAQEAEAINLDKITRGSADEFAAAMAKAEKQAAVPSEVDDQVAIVIDFLSAPYEKEQKRKRKIWTGAGIALACVCVVAVIIIALSIYNPPALDENLTYYADIEIKDYGTITVQLDQSAAPFTCANFVYLAESGFYDGLTFHRIMEGFMMQGGDPLGNGTGGSDKKIKGEFKQNGVNNPLSHTRGAISMARSNQPDSASSQFFIVHADSTFLDGAYAAFGYVTEGIEVVDKVCEDAKPVDNNGTIPADAQPVIKSITIVR